MDRKNQLKPDLITLESCKCCHMYIQCMNERVICEVFSVFNSVKEKKNVTINCTKRNCSVYISFLML